MTLQQYEPLTQQEQDLLRTFKTCLRLDSKTEFSSDDFRKYGLDRFMHDTQHSIGGLFRKWLQLGLTEKIGYTRSTMVSNHYREIRLYRWKP